VGHSEGKVLLVLLQLIREGLEELVVSLHVLAAAPRVQEAALHGAGVPFLLLCDKALSFVYGHPLPPNFLSGVKAVVTEHCLVQDVPWTYLPTWGNVWGSSHNDNHTGPGYHQFFQGACKYGCQGVSCAC
jgi:hypothetical protein